MCVHVPPPCLPNTEPQDMVLKLRAQFQAQPETWAGLYTQMRGEPVELGGNLESQREAGD